LQAFPILATYVRDSGITVAQGLERHRWVRDIQGGVSVQAMAQYLHLWDLLLTVHLQAKISDELIWRLTEDDVWRDIRRWTGANFQVPSNSFSSTEDWWLRTRKQVPKTHRRNFDMVAILVHWKIWKERNSRVFENLTHSVDEVFEGIRDDIFMWRAAGKVAFD
jgi:hypothetical protein